MKSHKFIFDYFDKVSATWDQKKKSELEPQLFLFHGAQGIHTPAGARGL